MSPPALTTRPWLLAMKRFILNENLFQRWDEPLAEVGHLLGKFWTIRSEFAHDGRAALKHLGHHGLNDIKGLNCDLF
jgi:hypothetical protein